MLLCLIDNNHDVSHFTTPAVLRTRRRINQKNKSFGYLVLQVKTYVVGTKHPPGRTTRSNVPKHAYLARPADVLTRVSLGMVHSCHR